MPTSPIEIRPARYEDLPGLRDVAHATWRATYGGILPNTDIVAFLERNYAIDILVRRLERTGVEHGHRLLVAMRDGEVIGYAAAGINGDDGAELFSIYVLPAFHGMGAGWQLWRKASTFLADLGFDDFVVWVLDRNDRMRQFCERQGGVQQGERAFPVGERNVAEISYRAPTGQRPPTV